MGLCYTCRMASVLLCLSTSKYNSRVIEKGAQIAKNSHATLSAVYVKSHSVLSKIISWYGKLGRVFLFSLGYVFLFDR